MAGNNVEIVKRGFEAFNEGGIDGILPFVHPDFEATTPPELATEPQTYRGHDGIRRWFDSFLEVMDDIRWDPHRFEDLGDDLVLVEFTLRARGKTTGLDFGQDAVMLWKVAGDKAIEVTLHPTVEEARAAAEAHQAR